MEIGSRVAACTVAYQPRSQKVRHHIWAYQHCDCTWPVSDFCWHVQQASQSLLPICCANCSFVAKNCLHTFTSASGLNSTTWSAHRWRLTYICDNFHVFSVSCFCCSFVTRMVYRQHRSKKKRDLEVAKTQMPSDSNCDWHSSHHSILECLSYLFLFWSCRASGQDRQPKVGQHWNYF